MASLNRHCCQDSVIMCKLIEKVILPHIGSLVVMFMRFSVSKWKLA